MNQFYIIQTYVKGVLYTAYLENVPVCHNVFEKPGDIMKIRHLAAGRQLGSDLHFPASDEFMTID